MERLSHTVKAVIFDMDGTLFDTERISSEAWVEAGCALGDPMPISLIDSFRGKNDEGISQAMRTHLLVRNAADKDPEDISDAEVYPHRCFLPFPGNCLHIVGRQLNSRLRPGFFVF